MREALALLFAVVWLGWLVSVFVRLGLVVRNRQLRAIFGKQNLLLETELITRALNQVREREALLVVLKLHVVNRLSQGRELHLDLGGLATKLDQLCVLVCANGFHLVQTNASLRTALGDRIHDHRQDSEYALCAVQLRCLLGCGYLCAFDGLVCLADLAAKRNGTLVLNAQALLSGTEVDAHIEFTLALLLKVLCKCLAVCHVEFRTRLARVFIVSANRVG